MQVMTAKRMRRYRRQYRAGFTLVEILVTLAILTLLIGLIASGGTVARKKAKVYQAKTMVASLETALSLYHVDFGAYPPDGNQNMVNLLADAATYGSGSYPDWQGPYMSFKSNDLQGAIPNATLIDPWGAHYSYGLDTVPAYKIWSWGQNGIDENGSGDDLKSW
jgi:type II secretion system protein G